MKSKPSIAAPRPGPLFGSYPQRSDDAAAWRDPMARWTAWRGGRLAARARPHTPTASIRARQQAWALHWQDHRPPGLTSNFLPELHDLRARLGRDGLGSLHRADAIGCAAAAMQHSIGRNPFDGQLHCAQVLLDAGLAEMATGEGKTLAVALAAAVAALAGVPVHVMTANDYLAQRDARLLAPFFQALGLRVGVVVSGSDADARRAAYACELTYCTAREVAFDHLRDRQSLRPEALTGSSQVQQHAAALVGEAPPPRLLRGLCMALVDEADSLLIDEATMPLVLAEAVDDPAQRAACFQALALARRLSPGQDVQIDRHSHEVRWSAPGLARLEADAAGLDAAWHNARHRQDLVATALVALHALRRDEHYIVTESVAVAGAGAGAQQQRRVQLLDPGTGRSAPGRVWARGLQTLVELKEGCTLTAPTRTVAQTSYQRFFSRYLHLAGTSGTLAECRAELAAVYGLAVVRVRLRRACRRTLAPPQRFANDAARHRAVLDAAREMQRAGRPLLIGCASVRAARELSAQLAAAGMAHRVLDASHDASHDASNDASDDASEAAIVAQAGQRGALTVATAMAGRGTDIELGVGVAAAGGLHVIGCQDNLSARLDRQFIGRAARQGDPGSAVLWHSLDVLAGAVTNDSSLVCERRNKTHAPTALRLLGSGWMLDLWHAWRQRSAQAQGMRQRRRLLDEDLSWQNKLDFKRLRG